MPLDFQAPTCSRRRAQPPGAVDDTAWHLARHRNEGNGDPSMPRRGCRGAQTLSLRLTCRLRSPAVGVAVLFPSLVASVP